MTTPSTMRYAGFAQEVTYGVDPGTTAFFVDIAESSLDVPDDPNITYGGSLTRGKRIVDAGFYLPEGDIQYGFDIRTVGWHLKWALGGYAFVAGVAPALNTHDIWGNNRNLLDSFTTRIGKDLFQHNFMGCVVDSLDLNVEDGFGMLTSEVKARIDSRATLVPEATVIAGLPAEFPIPFHRITVQRGATDISALVNSITLNINNNLEDESGRGLGSRFARNIVAQNREISLEAEIKFEDMTQLEAFWGGTTGPVAGGSTLQDYRLIFTPATGGNMTIRLPRCLISTLETQPSGRDVLTQSVTFTPLEGAVTRTGGTSVTTDILVTLQNAQGTMA